MEEKRYIGKTVLTGKATREAFEAALQKVENKMVALHKPGSIVTHSDGARYVVQADGSWKRMGV